MHASHRPREMLRAAVAVGAGAVLTAILVRHYRRAQSKNTTIEAYSKTDSACCANGGGCANGGCNNAKAAPKAASGGCCNDAKPAPKAAEPDSDMPPRMKAALERKKRDEAAAKLQASEAAAAGEHDHNDHSHAESKPVVHEHADSAAPKATPSSFTGPPPLGMIMSLAKETGLSRKECKNALREHGDYEAAKAALLPPPPEGAAVPPPLGTPVPGVYDPAPAFAGGRPGWMYKTGPFGVGYYRDAPMAVAVPKKG